MSKYDPLRDFLKSRPAKEAPMTFPQVEEVLGFELPPSARQYPAWWSNNVGTHVNARAWREAGWKASRVDLGREQVTFVREDARPFTVDTPADPSRADVIVIPAASLSLSALRMIDDWAAEAGVDRAAAIADILEASAAGRRRRLLEDLSVATMPLGHDSTTLIRQDRDER